MNRATQKILKMIENNGYEAYLVGGYPRDLYMHNETIDYDICTSATPKDLKSIFGSAILPTENYGSVTLIVNNDYFEITTFRRDIKYINNRTPIEFEYIKDLHQDLQRRDFIMNTMCINSHNEIIDMLGARQDIDNKIIRTVGDAYEKLSEDSLRILRAIRFATILNFKLDDELMVSIKETGHLLKNLSYYRKKEELDKIFSSPNIKYGLQLISELGLDKYLELNNIDSIIPTTDLIGIWAQLDVIDIYSFNKSEKELINKFNELKNLDILDNNNLYKYGLYISMVSGEYKGIKKNIITEKYNSLYIKSRKDINLTALDICNILKIKPSKKIKDIYDDLEIQLVNKKILNDPVELTDYVSKKHNNK